MNWKEFFTGYKGKDLPEELRGFNWGAFLLTFIWGIKHKAWITLLGIPLLWFQLPLGLNLILFTILQFYCGFKGNMWAYQQDWWMSVKDFRKTQAIWAIAAISLNILIPMILLALTLQFIKKSPDNPKNLILNTQCAIANSNLKHGLKKVSINSSVTSKDIAYAFSKQFKNTTVNEDSVKFFIKENNQKIDIYYITFLKDTQNPCNFETKNCTINSGFILPDEISINEHCQFYYNDKREFIPDEQTKKILKKGYNFFKYL